MAKCYFCDRRIWPWAKRAIFAGDAHARCHLEYARKYVLYCEGSEYWMALGEYQQLRAMYGE